MEGEEDLERLFESLEEDRGGSKGYMDCKEKRADDGNHDDSPGLGREDTDDDDDEADKEADKEAEAAGGVLEAELQAAAADLAYPKNETFEASASSDSPSGS